MLLRDLPKLSRMRKIIAFLPLDQIMGVNSKMKDLTNFVESSELSTTFQHQGSYDGLVVVDDYSCFTWTLFIATKDEVYHAFKRLVKVI